MGKQTAFFGVRENQRFKSETIAYRAFIHTKVGRKRVQRNLGSFKTAEAAARQYDCVALAWRGPEAKLNFSSAKYSADDIKAALKTVPDRLIKTSVYKGVCVTKEGRFAATTKWQYKKIWLGTYSSETYAAEQHDLAQIQLHGGIVTAVPPYRLNSDWSQHTPEAIMQLLPRVTARVAAGLLSQPAVPQQPYGVQSTKAQTFVLQAVAEPESSLHNCHSSQLLKWRPASSQPDSDDRPATGAPQAKRQQVGRTPHPAAQQAACKGISLSDMAGQQSTQQLPTKPHPTLQATAAVLPATLCQQAAAAAACFLPTAVPLIPAVAHVSKGAVGALPPPFKTGKAHDQQLNQVQSTGGKAAAAKSVAQPGFMKQQHLQQLLTDDLHAAAVLVYCADDAYGTAKAAGLPRRQLKSCRRDVQAAVQQLATTIAQKVVSLSSKTDQAGCHKVQPAQQAHERTDAQLSSSSQQQHEPLQCHSSHNSRPRCSQEQSSTSERQRLKELVDLFTAGRAAR